MGNIGAAARGLPSTEGFEPTTEVQAIAMHATDVFSLVSVLFGAPGPATVMTAESKTVAVVAAETGNAEAAAVHGNSLQNPNPTHVYRIDGPQGL
jgi:hypothetical protein